MRRSFYFILLLLLGGCGTSYPLPLHQLPPEYIDRIVYIPCPPRTKDTVHHLRVRQELPRRKQFPGLRVQQGLSRPKPFARPAVKKSKPQPEPPVAQPRSPIRPAYQLIRRKRK